MECPLAANAANLPEYRYRPVSPPGPELVATYGDPNDQPVPIYEVIDHLGQLVDSLKRGTIGIEYYRALSAYEIARVW